MVMKTTKYKIGEIVLPRFYIAGNPTGLSVDTRSIVKEVRKDLKRLRVERDDGRLGSWWVDFGAVRKVGEN